MTEKWDLFRNYFFRSRRRPMMTNDDENGKKNLED